MCSIYWNDDLDTILFHEVFEAKAHLKDWGQMESKWESVMENFLKHEETKHFTKPISKNKPWDKFRKRFNERYEQLIHLIDQGGNTSAQPSEDRPKLYGYIKTIFDDRIKEAEIKEKADGKQLKLNLIAENLLLDSGSQKRKLKLGDIEVKTPSSNSAKKPKTFIDLSNDTIASFFESESIVSNAERNGQDIGIL